MPTTTRSDLELADALAQQFTISRESGWDLFNSGVFADRDQSDSVINILVARGVLFRCPCGHSDALFDLAVEECICEHIAPRCAVCEDEGCRECDPHYEDDYCPGGCNQPSQNCTCAELDSWQRYINTPMGDRCGPWTA